MEDVAIPSNRVNVSYLCLPWSNINLINNDVAIPSNRVNVSYHSLFIKAIQIWWLSRNPLKSGQCFLLRVLVGHLTVAE